MGRSGFRPGLLFAVLMIAAVQGRAKERLLFETVCFWTSGKQPNHGFMLHGDSRDDLLGHSREAKELKPRPAVQVIDDPE